MKTFFCLISMLLCALLSYAQDLHFSQLVNNPHNLNAAEIGFFDGNLRVNAVVRNQWKSIPVPYQTNCFALDFSKLKKIKNINLGLVFNNDKSGDSRYTQNSIMLGLSKIIKLNNDSTLLFSVGMQNGFSSNYFQNQNLTFDSQYDGTLYNSSLSNNENFSTSNTTNFNSNIGGLFAYQYSALNKIIIGFSAQQIFSNKLSYFSNNAIQSNPKFILYSKVEHNFSGELFLFPYVGFIQREKNRELTLGTSIGKKVTINAGQAAKPYFGVFFRNRDAYFFQLGAIYNQINFAMSYDVNYSKLKIATNNKGAVEFTLVYIFKKAQPFIIPQKHCPVFL